jgi:predicted small lipoprotein YifL
MKKILFLSTTLLLLVLLTTCGEKEHLFEREKAPVSQEEEYSFSLDDALSYTGKFQLQNKNLITKAEVKAVSQSMSIGNGLKGLVIMKP